MAKGNKNWKDIFADKKNYKDDMVIKMGEDEYTLGDLRSFNDDSQGALAQQMDSRKQALDQREVQLNNAQNEVANLFTALSEVTGMSLEEMQATARGGKKTTTNKATNAAASAADALANLDESDPVVGPLVKAIKAMQTNQPDNSQFVRELADVKKALGIALKVNLDDHYTREFKEHAPKFVPEKMQKEIDLPKVLDYAKNNNMLDTSGRFNVQRALDDMTRDARHAGELEAAEQRGRDKAKEELALANIQPPGHGRAGLVTSPKNSDGHTKTIEQVLADAAQDPAIWKNAMSVASTGTA